MTSDTANRYHITGIWMIVSASICFSSAGVFTKFVSANAWSVIFWRGLFAALFALSYVSIKGNLQEELWKMGLPGLWVAIICSLGSVAFIFAFKLTTVANVAIIYAVAPLMAAILSWVWIKERPIPTVIYSSLVAFLGIVILVQQTSGGSFHGNLCALWMTLAAASMMVIYRRYPDTPAAGPAILSLIILLPIALLFGKPLSTSLKEIFIIAVFGFVFAFAVVALNEGSRRLASSEAALLSLLETPLSPLWAWLVLAEYPSKHTYLGGALVICSIIGSQWVLLRSQYTKL